PRGRRPRPRRPARGVHLGPRRPLRPGRGAGQDGPGQGGLVHGRPTRVALPQPLGRPGRACPDRAGGRPMRTTLVTTLCELAESDERLILLTADLGWGALEPFAAAFPERFLNVGVAEQNAMGVATGLALEGYLPFVYSIATFATMRCYEQFRDGPELHRLPVRLVGIGGGFAYGHAGPTHHALEDLCLGRALPGVTVVAPADAAQAREALRATPHLPRPAS